jgi:hypothetical protein
MIIMKEQAVEFDKQGVRMRVYNTKAQCPEASVVYQETREGHHEEFYHGKSNFIFYIRIKSQIDNGPFVTDPVNARLKNRQASD